MFTVPWADTRYVASLARVSAIVTAKAAAIAVMIAPAMAMALSRSALGTKTSTARLPPTATSTAKPKQPTTSAHVGSDVSQTMRRR